MASRSASTQRRPPAHPADLYPAVSESPESLLRHLAGCHVPEFLGIDVTISLAKLMPVARLQPGISMSALDREALAPSGARPPDGAVHERTSA
jgi:hypothetical protein